MLPAESPDGPLCVACLTHGGLCHFHARHVLPQLAENLGWLRLMGDALIEQKRLQSLLPPTDDVRAEKAKRREGRKRARQKQHTTLVQGMTPLPVYLDAVRAA